MFPVIQVLKPYALPRLTGKVLRIKAYGREFSGINNPCPSGWRLPTYTELNRELLSWSQSNYYGAFASPLKLTAGGTRNTCSAAVGPIGAWGSYWISTLVGTDANDLAFRNNDAYMLSGNRSGCYSVRCIKT